MWMFRCKVYYVRRKWQVLKINNNNTKVHKSKVNAQDKGIQNWRGREGGGVKGVRGSFTLCAKIYQSLLLIIQNKSHCTIVVHTVSDKSYHKESKTSPLSTLWFMSSTSDWIGCQWVIDRLIF